MKVSEWYKSELEVILAALQLYNYSGWLTYVTMIQMNVFNTCLEQIYMFVRIL